VKAECQFLTGQTGRSTPGHRCPVRPAVNLIVIRVLWVVQRRAHQGIGGAKRHSESKVGKLASSVGSMAPMSGRGGLSFTNLSPAPNSLQPSPDPIADTARECRTADCTATSSGIPGRFRLDNDPFPPRIRSAVVAGCRIGVSASWLARDARPRFGVPTSPLVAPVRLRSMGANVGGYAR
jgi:hypothetical protein